MTELLSPSDVSYDRIRDLLDELLDRTERGLISWERSDGEYLWETTCGGVDVGPGRIRIWNDRGQLLRSFKPDTDALLTAAASWHEKWAAETIDSIISELDRMATSATGDSGALPDPAVVVGRENPQP